MGGKGRAEGVRFCGLERLRKGRFRNDFSKEMGIGGSSVFGSAGFADPVLSFLRWKKGISKKKKKKFFADITKSMCVLWATCFKQMK